MKETQILSGINPLHPVDFIFEKMSGNHFSCTIFAFDYDFEFSLLSGIISSSGFTILKGNVFTYTYSETDTPKNKKARLKNRRNKLSVNIRKNKIMDKFSGELKASLSFDEWQNLIKKRVSYIINLLEQNDSESVKKAKEKVNDWVSRSLSKNKVPQEKILYPADISIDNKNKDYATIKVISLDTPFFLYSLSTALSLNQIIILRVNINTIDNKIIDEFDVVHKNKSRILDENLLGKIKLSILLTKQFTYFLSESPNPYKALIRFENIVKDFVDFDKYNNIDELSQPKIMKELAKLLGTSDFLWEDFIHLQYENLIPLLKTEIKGSDICLPAETIHKRLKKELAKGNNFTEKTAILNEFKDNETFRIDLQHILIENFNFLNLSRRLTILAENIIDFAFKLAFEKLTEKYGYPKTVANLDARYSIFGLGKFGGAALGYASDIEILFIYSDNGMTDGSNSIRNSHFFNLLVKEATGLIKTKREGIFQIDLRLRPFGSAGDLACSLANFCDYYSKTGKAYSYERLSLVRLRAVSGDIKFGKQVERIRDDLVYTTESIDIEELFRIRKKQIKEKTKKNSFNTKFDQGALVDIEYTVQILQIQYGKDHESMRTAKIHDALDGLTDAGILAGDERKQLIDAYHFFRRLINGLRILRGSALDLFLPETNSSEFIHLARRIGYKQDTFNELEPEKQLYMDIEAKSAVVRAFLERHFKHLSMVGSSTGSVADIIILDTVSESLKKSIFKESGFNNFKRAYVNLIGLSEKDSSKENFAKLAVLAFDILKQMPDPDMALNNWERFVQVTKDPEGFYQDLLSQPMHCDILLSIFSTSQYLSDILIGYPDFYIWVMKPENINNIRDINDIIKDLEKLSKEIPDDMKWIDFLKRYKKKEILRIGTKDICLKKSFNDVVTEISLLAEAVFRTTVTRAFKLFNIEPDTTFCFLAFGKLGGYELNYSSDIDLLVIYNDDIEKLSLQNTYKDIIEKIVFYISAHTKEGFLYRADFRLRPYGRSGLLANSLSSILEYYREKAGLWEIQALLKLRPIAGNLDTGHLFLKKVKTIINKDYNKPAVVESIRKNRESSVRKSLSGFGSNQDIKNGIGGIRDIEFLVQGLQLLNLKKHHDLFEGNTLQALKLLNKYSIINESDYNKLNKYYIFLRRIEHLLQIFQDRQTHSIPEDEEKLTALAKRVLGAGSDTHTFNEKIKMVLKDVRNIFDMYIF